MRSENPFFSFIIPVYNVERYLPECIESILNQSFKCYEIILVNDGSTDKSLEICDYFQRKDARVKILNKENEGLAETRNKGIKIASGEYLIFLDSDDHLEKKGNGLSELFNILKCKDIDVLLFNLVPFSLNEKMEYLYYRVPKFKEIKETENLSIIFKKRIYLASACNKIVRREVVTKNHLKFPTGKLSEDISWGGDLLKSAKTIKFYPIDLYFYRKNRENSITFRTSRKNLLDILEQIKSHYSFMNSNENYKNKILIDEFYSFYYLSCIKQMCEHEEFSYNEIVSLLKPLSVFLKLSFEPRVFLFRIMVKIIGFDLSIKLLKKVIG